MITKYPIKASDVDVSYMQEQLTEDIADIANRAYEQGREDVIDECIAIVSNDNCILENYCNQQCVECICRRLKELKESQNES